MKNTALGVWFVFIAAFCNAQSDTLTPGYEFYTLDFKFTDGVYLNFEQVKNNAPLLPSRLNTTLDYTSMDFYDKLFEEKQIYVYDNVGNQVEIEVKNIWGYAQNGILYINLYDDFNRMGIIGSIAHFVATRKVYTPPTYNSYYGYYDSYRAPVNTTTEMQQFLLNFDTGEYYPYTPNSVELLLMKDPVLYDEYSNLRARKKKQLMFFYIRKYNEKHQLKFPVSTN